jgi:dipeptidyl aminopeptidase/acylaminoacyl peptidase
LTKDGTSEHYYRDSAQVSPDGHFAVVSQVKPAQEHKVYMVESSPRDQLQPKLKTIDYLKPGDQVEQERPRLFDLREKREVSTSDVLFSNPWNIEDIGWSEDSRHYRFLFNQRGHQHLRILDMDTAGQVRPLVDEQSPTFIDYSQKTYFHLVSGSPELIWASERDGWNHLYLYDTATGQVKNQITKGNWVMREVVRVDDAKRQIWFRAFGLVPGQDPYYSQLARINFDGSGLTLLTSGDGTHSWKFSPDNRFLLDTYSRVDLAPVTVLRDAETGKEMCALETGDMHLLTAAGWSVPERFASPGRDGQTAIYGIIIRPSNFDPAKKYPVIENIYAGPHDFFVPKRFDLLTSMHSLAELGFIVVQIDGMGTNWRSRAFHDVCWKNLKDGGFPDRIAWMRAAAETRPWMDLDRVGIYGGSAGGQNALAALLFYGDFYKAAAADCGCHDNRMDKIWWNEAWMGWPVGPEYADNSNVTHAANLKGDLLLIVGELDTNVDPASTMQVVNALIKADKDFDLLVVPGAGHGAGGSPYGVRRQRDFFVRHLLGVAPPARNPS